MKIDSFFTGRVSLHALPVLAFTLLLLPTANGANKFRLYDFEDGTAGNAAASLTDTITDPFVDGSNGAAGLLWLEVSGNTTRPLPMGGAMTVVDNNALAAPALNPLFGSATYVDVSDGTSFDSPSPGSTTALQFDGFTNYDDTAAGGGSRGVYVDAAAYQNNDPIAGGTNTFESFSVLTQAWIRPDSSAMGSQQIVYALGDEQGAAAISSDGFWKATNLGPFVPGGAGEYLSTEPVAFDEWSHVAIFRGGSNVEMYVNGNLVAGDPNATDVFFNGFAQYTSIGADGLGFDGFTGLVDDFTMSGFADTTFSPADDLDFFQTVPGVLSINQETGELTLSNSGDTPLTFSELSIRSGISGLNPTQWLSIAENYDVANGGELDATDNWEITMATGAALEEMESPTNDGAMLAPGQSVSLGDIWFSNPTRDIVMDLTELDGTITPLRIEYVDGSGIEVDPIVVGDLDFEGTITLDDWQIFIDNMGSILDPATSIAESYGLGDFDGDLDVDLVDYQAFVTAFDAANGEGAFARMVPEPTTPALFILFGLGWFSRRRRPV